MARNSLWVLNENDLKIFAKSKENPNIFLEWYFRSRDSGTIWQPRSPRKIVSIEYDAMYALWTQQHQPRSFVYDNPFGRDEVVVRGMDRGLPIFHQKHGFRIRGWQLDAWFSKAYADIFVGGFGSGKTLLAVARTLYNAVTLPGYRGFYIGPHAEQANELKKKAMDLMRGTRFYEQFYISDTKKPSSLTVGNDLVGETTLECIPMLDEPEKVKNLEGDEAVIDQFEDLNIDNEFKANLISRLRGYDIQSAREKLAKTTWVGNANSDDPGFLNMLDEAQQAHKRGEHDEYGYFQPDSRDNIYTSDRQLAQWRKQFVKTQEDEDVYFKGIPQAGKGKYFPKSSIDRCKTKALNEYMAMGLGLDRPGFVRDSLPGVGIYLWETPKDPNGHYIQVIDPGWGNPPERNAPCLVVLNVANFPAVPARLAAFAWLPAHGSPDPWLYKCFEYATTYDLLGRTFYDATGPQKGYERFVKKLTTIGAQPIGLQSGEKDAGLTGLRTILSQGLFQYPEEITGIERQLLKYTLPDKEFAQDIVMALALMTVHLGPLLLEDEKPEKEVAIVKPDRHTRINVHRGRRSRHGRHKKR